MKNFATALVLFVAFSFLAVSPASAGWYSGTVTNIGPVAGSTLIGVQSSSWSNTTRYFWLTPTMANSMTAIALTAMTSSRSVSLMLDSATEYTFCTGMMIQ